MKKARALRQQNDKKCCAITFIRRSSRIPNLQLQGKPVLWARSLVVQETMMSVWQKQFGGHRSREGLLGSRFCCYVVSRLCCGNFYGRDQGQKHPSATLLPPIDLIWSYATFRGPRRFFSLKNRKHATPDHFYCPRATSSQFIRHRPGIKNKD